MRLLKLNINAPHDWRGDLSICIKAMKHLIIFCAAVLVITMVFLPIYHVASKSSRPFCVYSIEDWQVAVNDPFISTIILHDDVISDDVRLAEVPNRKMTFIKAY